MAQSGALARTVLAMPVLLAIALGGMVGSLGRFGVAEAMGGWDGEGLPSATLIVNIVGCLVIGVVIGSGWVDRGPAWRRPFVVTGILGGFTTFSAFAAETGLLLDAGKWTMAAIYVLVTMIAGLLAVHVVARLVGQVTR